jgi:hypothetical protein
MEYYHCKKEDKNLIKLKLNNDEEIVIKQEIANNYTFLRNAIEERDKTSDEMIEIPIFHKYLTKKILKDAIDFIILWKENIKDDGTLFSEKDLPKTVPEDKSYEEIIPKWALEIINKYCIETCDCGNDNYDCNHDIEMHEKTALRKFTIFIDFLGNLLILNILCTWIAKFIELEDDLNVIARMIEQKIVKTEEDIKNDLKKYELLNIKKI